MNTKHFAIYVVTYKIDGVDTDLRQTAVHLTEGYSTFGDIPKIISVSRTGSNRPEDVAKVHVLSCVLHDVTEQQ